MSTLNEDVASVLRKLILTIQKLEVYADTEKLVSKTAEEIIHMVYDECGVLYGKSAKAVIDELKRPRTPEELEMFAKCLKETREMFDSIPTVGLGRGKQISREEHEAWKKSFKK